MDIPKPSLLFALFALATGVVHAATVDFSGMTEGAPPPGWTTANGDWQVQGEALWQRTPGPASYIVIDSAGEGGNVTVETSLIVRRRAEKGWCFAGVAIRRDASNFWHLALVEAPPARDSRDGVRSVELLECRKGFRNAQNEGNARLTRTKDEGAKFAWEYNHLYRLRLVMRDDSIEGILTEPDGTVRTHLQYRLPGFAVRGGKPGLCSAQLIAVFDDFTADVKNAGQSPQR